MDRDEKDLSLGFNDYLRLLEVAVRNPELYAHQLRKISLSESLVFFIVNSFLLVIISATIRTFLIGKSYLFFAILSESLALLPLLYLAILIFSFILFILAKVFKSRSRFKNNLKAILLSSILLPFFAVPVFKILAAIITLFILIFCFKHVHRFDKVKAFLAVTIPISIVIYALTATGIVNINLIIR